MASPTRITPRKPTVPERTAPKPDPAPPPPAPAKPTPPPPESEPTGPFEDRPR
jgi:hypothetical protein